MSADADDLSPEEREAAIQKLRENRDAIEYFANNDYPISPKAREYLAILEDAEDGESR